MNLDKIEESFKIVYGPISKAIEECLVTLQNVPVNATAVASAIIAVAIDIAGKTNAIAISQGHKAVIDPDHLARFVAFTLTNVLNFSPEMKQALDTVILTGIKHTSEKEKLN